MEKFTIELKPSQFANSWAVYAMYDKSGEKLLYLGVERLSQLFTLSNARANPFFSELFKDDEKFVFMLTDVMPNKVAAMNRYSEHIRRVGMPDAIKRHTLHKAVECLNTGEIFETLTACAIAHGINQGALSKHLRNAVGYRTLKGKTYRRTTAQAERYTLGGYSKPEAEEPKATPYSPNCPNGDI